VPRDVGEVGRDLAVGDWFDSFEPQV
jgi:hypothetical protein